MFPQKGISFKFSKAFIWNIFSDKKSHTISEPHSKQHTEIIHILNPFQMSFSIRK